jgi:glycolate oxidase FAD binding subunit
VSDVITIDEFPLPVQRPDSVAALGELVRTAEAVYPVGGGTRLGIGWTPTRAGIALDLRGLDAVIDYPARDMTITVQAGITLAKLQAILARSRRPWAAVSPPT